MKLQQFCFTIAAALLVAGCGQDQQKVEALQAQVAELQAQVQSAEEQKAVTQARPEPDNLELVRLRGEVAGLRPLQKQVQQLQSENAQLKSQVQQLQRTSGDTAALRAQNEQLQSAFQTKIQTDTCVASLRQIEAAKSAWAAQFQKQPADLPTDADLFGPGKPLPQKPVCAAGGVYTLNPVAAKAVCSVPGHTY